MTDFCPGSGSSLRKSRQPRYRARPGPDLRGANFEGQRLWSRNWEAADLRGANLRAADLRGTELFGARLEGADLRGAFLDMLRLVEIRIPKDLDIEIVNQIRAFDFKVVMTRFVGPNRHSEKLPCPYRQARLSPLLYEWGSRTWNQGRDWVPPERTWTLEEIIAAVLDALGVEHDLTRPFGLGATKPLSSEVSC